MSSSSDESEGALQEEQVDGDGIPALPQKRHYRQRAHCNPWSDHCLDYPRSPACVAWSDFFTNPTSCTADELPQFLDVGCGYGGLLVTLSSMFPATRMVGMEIRVKVSDYVQERIAALRERHPGQYGNICCIRTNAMKFLPNYFKKAQLTKMFILFPDPHFKRVKHKWRIVSSNLLAEYAYLLQVGARVYTITDVKEVHDWMVKHFTAHPLFQRLSDEDLEHNDEDREIVSKLYRSTEEGQKVARNQQSAYPAVFKRISASHEKIHCD